jgi:RHS repeat-associated protein
MYPNTPPPTVACTTCPCPPPPPTHGPSGPNGPNGPGAGAGAGAGAGPGTGAGAGAGAGAGSGPDIGPGSGFDNMPSLGPYLSRNPVRGFDGFPVISATDLQSDAFGFSWGITRSWVGTDIAEPVGNGWAVTGLPQIVVGGGLYVDAPPGGGGGWTPSDAPAGSYPDDRLEVVDGGTGTFTFSIANGGPYESYSPWGGQTVGLQLTWDQTNHLLNMTDAAGNVTTFYDVDRDASGKPIPNDDPTQLYGKFKSYTTADGTVTMTANYVAGNVTSVTRSDSTTGQGEEFDFTYSTVTNDLVTAAGGTAPQLATNIAWKQNNVVIRQAVYDYYTGRLPDGSGGYVNDPNGRLGDLRTVTIEDGAGNPISQDYYRYYKFTAESDLTSSPGPTNDEATTGGPAPLQPALANTDPLAPATPDAFVYSGLKTVVNDAEFSRLAAAVPNYQTASDAAIQPYVSNFFTYERWGDHSGADGQSDAGAAAYNNNDDLSWRVGYRFGTNYRVTGEISQGSGCSSCTGGQGTDKYEYAGNYYFDPNTSTYPGVGYGVIDYNVWRMKQTEYLSDDTPGNWTDNDRQVTYTNEVGEPLLSDYVHVGGTPLTITGVTLNDPIDTVVPSGHVYQVDTAGLGGLSVGQYVALSGILPEYFNGVFKVVAVDSASNSFEFVLPVTYYDQNVDGYPHAYVDQTLSNSDGSQITIGPGAATPVLSQTLTDYRYDDSGRCIEVASPSAVNGADDSQMDLVDAADMNGNVTPLGLISPNRGDVQLYSYSGWSFDGQAGIAGNGASVLGTGAPDTTYGTQAGFLQDQSVISQTVDGWAAGTYTISFSAAEIGANSARQTETFAVYVDGTLLTFNGGTSTAVAPASTYASYTSDAFTVSAGMHQVRFVGLGDTTMGTAMVDNVQVPGTSLVTDGSFEADQVGSGNYALNPSGYAITANATTGGSVAGEMEEAFTQQGQQGTAVPQESVTYYAQTAGSSTIFLLASDTGYGNTDGTDARTYRYSYTFYGGTNQMQSETTIAPPITSAQNGPATSNGDTADADTTSQYFDPEGRRTWTRDGGGFLTYTAYDDLSGGVTKFINDVNTADTGDFTNLPAGWTTPSGGGLELITLYSVDSLGRTTKQTDPNGNITYTVYNDPGHETRVYPGWHLAGSTWTTTGPIQVTREHRPAAGAPAGQQTVYDETLTSSATPTVNGSNQPTGQEAIDQTNIQSLSREITNDAGQMVEEDDYFSLAGVTYAQATPQLGSSSNDSATGNYHATLYHYNSRGWQDKVVDPTGTTTRTVYNGLHRVLSTWVGTNDTPASGYWSPTNNTAPSNMVDVQDDYYDQRLAGPTAPTLGETAGGTLASAVYTVVMTYVTPNGESAPSAASTYTTDFNNLLTVASPAAAAGATGYNVYLYTSYIVGGIPSPMLQNSTPIPIGSSWTEPTSGVVAGALPPVNGIGDSNLTETIQHPGGGAADRVTLNLYDWRDRLIASKQGALLDSSGNPNPAGETDGVHRLITSTSYDNLNEPVASRTYAGDGVSLNDFATWTSTTDASKLRAYSTQSYDDQGRVYLAQTCSVDPTTGAVGASLATNTYYDHRGEVIDESDPGGLVTKHQFDGAGRDIKDSTTDGGVLNGAAQSWANAGTTVNDMVLEQTLNSYDGDGNQTETVHRQRFDSDPTQAGAGGTGDLAGPTGGSLASRDYYTANYYDAANRLTDSVNVGTNGGVVWARPATVPADSDTVLVTHTDYEAAGNVLDTIDPRGIKAGTFYDLLGRKVETIAAWDGSQNPTPTSSTNQITTYAYDGNNDVLTMTAVMPSGTPSQATAYVYGTTSTSGVFSNDLLAKVEYPDLTTGAASTAAANDEVYTYNALGQKTTMLDRNGTTHQYGYDVLARLTSDIIPWWAMGAGVSTQTTGLTYSFNDAGLPFQQTSLTNWDQSAVENQVEDLYNGYGQLIQQYQEINGAVNPATSQSVQYGYSQIGNANRLTSMAYPDGRREDYEYYSGLDTAISRIRAIADDQGSAAGVVAAYAYLGLNTIMQEVEPQANVELTYIQVPGDTHAIADGGDRYTGLDRFGRVIDQAYYVTTSPPSAPAFLDRIQYGYDRDGNVLYANNLVNGAFSELYHASSMTAGDNNSAYDPLNRITSFSRGTLTSSGNNGSTLDTITGANLNSTSGVPNTNSWNLDALGNWNSGNGQSNTFNSQNEETTNGSNTLAYDNAGDMTTDEQGNTYGYDAWGRVVQIKDSSGASLETFAYDALGRNVVQNNGGGTIAIVYDASGRQIQAAFASIYSQYVWGLSYVNDLILRDRNADGNMSTGNLGINGSGLDEREYAQHDKQFSVVSLTNQTGTVIQRIVYDPYGKATLLTATWAYDTSMGGTNYWFVLFQGMTYVADGASGNLLQSQTRLYDVSLGRWISQDPDQYVDGMSRYRVEGANPLTHVDPSGLKMSSTECALLLAKIMLKAAALWDDLSRYDPILDGQGGFPTHGGKLTKPGGHYQEIKERQSGIKSDLANYFKHCMDPNCPNWKNKTLRKIDEMANQSIPEPVIPSFLGVDGSGNPIPLPSSPLDPALAGDPSIFVLPTPPAGGSPTPQPGGPTPGPQLPLPMPSPGPGPILPTPAPAPVVPEPGLPIDPILPFPI